MNDDTLKIVIEQDESGFYWRVSGEKFTAGPFHTRGSAKCDAANANRLHAGNETAIEFLE